MQFILVVAGQVAHLVEQLHHHKDIEDEGEVQRGAVCQASVGYPK